MRKLLFRELVMYNSKWNSISFGANNDGEVEKKIKGWDCGQDSALEEATDNTGVFLWVNLLHWLQGDLTYRYTWWQNPKTKNTHIKHLLDVQLVVDPISQDVLVLAYEGDVGVGHVHSWFLWNRGQESWEQVRRVGKRQFDDVNVENLTMLHFVMLIFTQWHQQRTNRS